MSRSRSPRRWRPTSGILRLGLLAIVLTSSSACVTESYSGPCPPWPVAGEKVAEELEAVPYEGFEDFYGWLARLDVLRDQLERCRE